MINIDAMIKSRTLPISFTIEFENGKTKKVNLELKSMKLKALRKLKKLQKKDDEDSVLKRVKTILNNNKKNYHLKDDEIDELTTEQLQAIAKAYMKWVEDNQKN